MQNKKLKARILEWLCKKYGITNINVRNDIFSYTISNDKSKNKYLFVKNNYRFKVYNYIFAHEHLDKLNINQIDNTYKIKSLEPWQILDIFLDESKKGYSIYVISWKSWKNLSSNYKYGEELERIEFIKSNSSLETLAIEMDLNS